MARAFQLEGSVFSRVERKRASARNLARANAMSSMPAPVSFRCVEKIVNKKIVIHCCPVCDFRRRKAAGRGTAGPSSKGPAPTRRPSEKPGAARRRKSPCVRPALHSMSSGSAFRLSLLQLLVSASWLAFQCAQGVAAARGSLQQRSPQRGPHRTARPFPRRPPRNQDQF